MQPEVFLDLNDALHRLEEQDPRKARVIEMRFFGGLTAEETAEMLGISVETVRRDLRLGQAFLQRELTRLPEMKGSLEALPMNAGDKGKICSAAVKWWKGSLWLAPVRFRRLGR